MKTQDAKTTDEVAVDRICAGNHGMCGYKLTSKMISCPICGSKHSTKLVPTDDGAACFVASKDLVRENPNFSGFGPGHNFKCEHIV